MLSTISYQPTAAQKRHWFTHSIDETGISQNLFAGWILKGTIDLPRFCNAFEQVQSRHKILRSRFIHDGIALRAIISTEPSRMIVRRASDGADPGVSRQAWLKELSNHHFELDREAPIVGKLLLHEDSSGIFVILAHHCVCDGASLAVIAQDLRQAYRGVLPLGHKDIPADVPPCNGELLSGYVRRLNAVSKDPIFSHERTRRSFCVAANIATHVFTSEISQKFESWLYRLGISSGSGMLVLLSFALASVTSARSFVIGLPFSNRISVGHEDTVACLMNPVAVPLIIDEQKTIDAFAVDVAKDAAKSMEAASVPFDSVVSELGTRHNPGLHPIYQVQLNGYSPYELALELDGITAEPVQPPGQATALDIDLYFGRKGERLALNLLFDHSVVPSRYIDRIFEEMKCFIEVAVDKGGQKLEGLFHREQQPLTKGAVLCGPTIEAPPFSLSERIAEGLQLDVELPFLLQQDNAWSRGVVNSAVSKLSKELARIGVRPGHVIGLDTYNHVETIIALLGIHRVGAACMPLALDQLPQDRVAAQMHEARCSLVLTAREGPSDKVALSHWRTVANLNRDNLPMRQSVPPETAYVLYTSGTTGRPKGVLVAKDAVLNVLEWTARNYDIGKRDTLLWISPLSFDISILETLLPAITGAKLVVPGSARINDWDAIAALAAHSCVSILQIVPSLAVPFLDAAQRYPTRLRHTFFIGEALSGVLAKRFAASLRCPVWNHYGPTEATVHCTAIKVAEPVGDDGAVLLCKPCEDGSVTIGVPISNIEVNIVARNGATTEIGATGEIVVSGIGVAQGYLRQPELTRQKFRPISGKMCHAYWTGDRGRVRSDGTLEFLGRQDSQVKVRGFRIELGEIENALRAYGSIKQAIVVAVGDEDRRQLVGFYEADREYSNETLLTHLVARLPSYAVPSKIIRIASWKTTISGKTDRRAFDALAKNYSTMRSDSDEGALAGDEMAEIWCEVLGVRAVGPNDDFFDLGGTSLQAARLAILASRKYRKTVNPRTVLEYPAFTAFKFAVEQLGEA